MTHAFPRSRLILQIAIGSGLALSIVCYAQGQPAALLPPDGSPPGVATAVPGAPANPEPQATEFFPSAFSPLMSNLSSTISLGTSCIVPGARISNDAVSTAAQDVKTQLAALGLEYQLQQSYILSISSDQVSGDQALNAYSFRFMSDWKLVRNTDFNGWVSFGTEGGTGLGVNWQTQSPGANIGSATQPTDSWNGVNAWVNELAWGMSFLGGKLAVITGIVDQTQYFDENSFSNTSRGQLMNSAFVNSSVLPMPSNNLGINVQWQPTDSLYLMAGTGTTNQAEGDTPFDDLGTSNMAYLLELGLINPNVLNLGRGVFRLQPFAATFAGDTGAGLCLNFEQQLGRDSGIGAFGRFGFCEKSVAAIGGSRAQAAAGLVINGPFADTSAGATGSSDYLGLGVAWTRDAVSDDSETSIELTYAVQVTPTMTIQPDVQMVLDPTNNPSQNSVFVFQLQVNVNW